MISQILIHKNFRFEANSKASCVSRDGSYEIFKDTNCRALSFVFQTLPGKRNHKAVLSREGFSGHVESGLFPHIDANRLKYPRFQGLCGSLEVATVSLGKEGSTTTSIQQSE